jgi:hypothetical protein
MKWFFGVVVLLNLFAALWGSLKTHPQVDIHAQEVSPRSIRLLPPDWGESTLAPRSDAASAALSVPPEAGQTKLTANLDSAPASAVSGKVAEAKALPKAEAQPALLKTELKAEAKPAVVAPPNACLNWGELSDKTLAKVKPELVALRVNAAEHARQVGRSGKYWVYVPAKSNAADTRKVAADLKAKGFDNYAVQNEGEFKGALSLGLFGKEEGATAMLEKLKSAGFADARVSQRGGKALTSLSFTGLTAQQTQALNALQHRLAPSSALKSVSCS